MPSNTTFLCFPTDIPSNPGSLPPTGGLPSNPYCPCSLASRPETSPATPLPPIGNHQTAEDIIWKAYVHSLLPYFGVATQENGDPDIGKEVALFVCPITQQGIPGGRLTPEAVTNYQCYHAGDDLIQPDSPIFIRAPGSYVEALQSYMAYVNLRGNPTEEAKQRLINAENDYDNAQSTFWKERQDAIIHYSQSLEHVLSFEDWVSQNEPYLASYNAMHEAASILRAASQEVYGSSASDFNQDLNELKNALSPSSVPGYNMACVTEDQSNGNEFYRPNYSLQGYSDLINEWIEDFNTNAVIELNLDLTSACRRSWTNYGFKSNDDANRRFNTHYSQAKFNKITHIPGQMPCRNLSFLGSFKHDHDSSAHKQLDLSSEPASILKMKVTYHGLQLVNIDTGIWDISGVRTKYPYLRADAPKDPIPSFARSEKFLVGYGPGMEITFNANTFQSACSLIKSSEDSHRRVSFFGFNIVHNPSDDFTISYNDVKINTETQTISIPAVDTKIPVLVGVIARRL